MGPAFPFEFATLDQNKSPSMTDLYPFLGKSPNRPFFELLLKYQNPQAAKWAWTQINQNDNWPGGWMLRLWLWQGGYKTEEEVGSLDLNSQTDFWMDLIEACRLLDLWQSELKQTKAAQDLAYRLLPLLNFAANFLAQNKENKKLEEVAELRDWLLYMACYFEDRKDKEGELSMRYARLLLSQHFFSTAPQLIGPDMIGVAKNLEEFGLNNKALAFFQAVISDFEPLYAILANLPKRSLEEKLQLWALKEAFLGQNRLAQTNLPNYFEQFEALLRD
ncbi:hypothetical protein SapgrDRAFT_3131 [Saprospira grandis DSM 2844]|uniref:DUF4034 domain-containing protein n=2 Tax=Saprospira TaxID=1007 RepID=J1I8H7_9BACT|nr:hypothetical protein SapgrDRAFT_3131 [Saprospira grandis DSM 2844]